MATKKFTDLTEYTGTPAATDWLCIVRAAAAAGSRDFKFKLSRLLVDATAFGISIAQAADAAAVRTLLALGTMATQAASAVAITGGNINGTTIGASVPGAAHFTTADLTGLFAFSSTDTITAHAGGGHASATALTTSVNRVSVCASDADSVKLPAWAAGLVVSIWNDTGHTLQVFGAGTDTINEVATDTGVAQATLLTALYIASAATGKWSRILSA